MPLHWRLPFIVLHYALFDGAAARDLPKIMRLLKWQTRYHQPGLKGDLLI
jgi:hypothetical protein